MEFLNQILQSNQTPFITAFVLGIMTAISPCPMAMNITAIGFISKDIDNKRRVFLNGLIYTLGRAISYTLLGLLFFFGASQFKFSGVFQMWGEKLLGPILLLIGIYMLDVIKFKGGKSLGISEWFESRFKSNYLGALIMGMGFALAFCPYSGVLFFGMLIPISIGSISGLYLPVVFAIATGLPVILFAWLLAFSISSVGSLYQAMQSIEFWFRKLVAIVFIGVGLYYIWQTLF